MKSKKVAEKVVAAKRRNSRVQGQDKAGVEAEAKGKTTAGKPSADGPSPAGDWEKVATMNAMRSNLLQFFELIQHSAAKIDEAFGGQPFLPDLRPDAPANIRRFKAYLDQHEEIVKLLVKAQQLWMLSFGFSIVREIRPARRRRRRSTRKL